MESFSNKALPGIIDRFVDKLTELFNHVIENNCIFTDNEETKRVIEETHSGFFGDLYWLYLDFLTIRICNLI